MRSAEPDVRLERLPPKVEPGVAEELQIPEAGVSRAPEGAEQVRFVLAGLDVEGVTTYPPEEIEGLYSGRVGTEVTLAYVYEVAARLQKKYRDDGYFLTRAIIPPQVGRDGRLRIMVVEGFISAIQFQGTVGRVRNLIESYLEQVLNERPLKLQTLERYLLLAKDIPGVDVNGVLRPAPDQVGAAELVVTAERKRFDGMALVDNFGTDSTGKWQTAVSGSANAFTSLGEKHHPHRSSEQSTRGN